MQKRKIVYQRGKLLLPQKIAEGLPAELMYVKRKGVSFLDIISVQKWRKIIEKIEEVKVAENRHLLRRVLAGSKDVQFDWRENKILIPRQFRKYFKGILALEVIQSDHLRIHFEENKK